MISIKKVFPNCTLDYLFSMEGGWEGKERKRMAQIIISGIIATIISAIILNFGDEILWRIKDVLDNLKEWLSKMQR